MTATPKQFHVRKAAVLGAGVMGAQIAAHLTNAGIPTLLYELPAKEGDKNGLAKKAIDNLAKLSPSPLGRKSLGAEIVPANYEEHLALLAGVDLIIEAVAERIDIKRDLYEKIGPHVADHAIIASNTSGLSITSLSDALPEQLRPRFCGVHFFNPPRYMYLVELIPTSSTRPEILDQLETVLTSAVGKGVIRAKDTPNFIANRVGVFSMLATMHHTQQFGLGFEEVDALTGTLVGRAKSATYRTADVVGLDTMGHVIKTLGTLVDDPWHQYFQAPSWLQGLISAGALGQKTGAGFYKKVGKDILVLDPAKGDYRPSTGEASAEAEGALKQRGWAGKLKALRESSDNHAQFMWACYRDVFHYIAYHLESIADNARDVDLAIRWGFGWNKGPFETWQEAGWQQVVGWIQEDIAAGKAMSSAPLPAWAIDPDRTGVHKPEGSWAPADAIYRPRSGLSVYQRQHFPDALSVESFDRGTTIFETDAARLWHQGDGVAIYTFKSKANTIGSGVIDGLWEAIRIAEESYQGLVIWQDKDDFSVGADLMEALPAVMAGQRDQVEAGIERFQATSMRIKYAAVPVVAAIRGKVFGGGCEFQMHAARTVAAFESYIGLVEAGVGLLPGGGGLKEFALRAAAAAIDGDVFSQVKQVFTTPAMAAVATSALEGKELKLLRPTDVIVMNAYELLYVAKNEARALAASGYRPPLPARAVPVAGDVGIATIKAQLTNMQAGGFASAHDVEVATRIGTVLCGGNIERGSLVDEQWLLALERKHFADLVFNPKSQERIAYTLQNGKPLRN